ncbi:hypothetical protein D8X55_02185 [Malacoplasma penetrans]|uniref:Z1 domain-containing protein n=1 Tax=Malacoplasma penetrans TaxID=28227 RepID=UPI00101156B6|nr:Z1 domain-containing protein [Malacoplasma penetrans]RXY96823.1 hypothetical protein D8X55_02185 [Malacoplasma penetrans]
MQNSDKFEKHYIEEESTLDNSKINISDYSQRVRNNHSLKYGEKSQNKTFARVKEIFLDSIKQMKKENKNVLLVGKVQSGKTSFLEMFTALALDNEFQCVILLGATDNKLLGQTNERFINTFTKNIKDVDGELYSMDVKDWNKKPYFTLADSIDSTNFYSLVSNKIPLFFVSLKSKKQIDKVCDFIEKNIDGEGNFLKTLIIDDEGDQASLNNKFTENEITATYGAISRMKELLKDHLYLSITATPHANVLLTGTSLKPGILRLIYPADGYNGSDTFHMADDSYFITIPNDEKENIQEGILTKSVLNAFYYFQIASAILKIEGISEYSEMIVHNDLKKINHKNLLNSIENKTNNLKEYCKKNNKEALESHFFELKSVYNKNYFNESILDKYKFNDLKDVIKKVIIDTQVILFNSDAKDFSNKEHMFHRIYIGGNLMQRGITFDYLITTFFTRWPKKGGNMDTTLQRARWFGYREKYLFVCKIFMPDSAQKEFRNLTETDTELWEQFQLVQTNALPLDSIVIKTNSKELNPTRRGVARWMKNIGFIKKWVVQKYGIFSKEENQKNVEFIEDFLKKFSFNESYKGWRKEEIKKTTCMYSEISVSDAFNLLENLNIFNEEPFDSVEWKKIFLDKKIILQKMFDFDKDKDIMKRGFYEDNQIRYLFQGEN